MNERNLKLRVSCAFAAMLLVLQSGCAINRRYVHDAARHVSTREVNIQYSVGTNRVNEVSTADWTPGAASRELSLVYPHPSPRFGNGYAQVTVRELAALGTERPASLLGRIRHPRRETDVESLTGDSRVGTAVTLALPRDELELLLQDLIADGLFDRGVRTGYGVQVAVQIDGRSVEKEWDRVDALERLMTRAIVASPGGHSKPPTKSDPVSAQSTPSSPTSQASTSETPVEFVPR